MLRGLVEARTSAGSAEGGQLAGPKRVVMVWAARHKAEFTILDESVLAAARCGTGLTAIEMCEMRRQIYTTDICLQQRSNYSLW